MNDIVNKEKGHNIVNGSFAHKLEGSLFINCQRATKSLIIMKCKALLPGKVDLYSSSSWPEIERKSSVIKYYHHSSEQEAPPTLEGGGGTTV